ncbi:MAG: trigger factor [Gammaproteobacteria bacterium]|nr:trigger factor [Gammaproteobacteria bacterium]NND61286.1 trigger factor [Gammaproteobacteria bacterium]
MQVSVESLGGLQRRMTVEVPSNEVEKEIEQRLKRVGKTAKLKGFRPGKVPYKVLEQRYGGEIRQDVLSELLRSSYAEAVTQEKLNPAGTPKIETDSMLAGADFRYTATFEVYPDIELKKVAGLKVERPVAEITDKDVDQVLDNLRSQRAHWHAVERKSKQGDQVNIDFEGRIDDEIFEGGTGNGVDVVVGAGQMLPDFDKALNGVSAGDDIKAKVRFPKDYHSDDVAGKKAVFSIQVNSVSEQHLPEVDEEFCKSFGIEDGSVDELRSGIRDNMEKELSERVTSVVREQVLEELAAANPVELPQSLVEAEARQLANDAVRQMGLSETPEDLPLEPFMDNARKRVARGLLVGQLVEQEGISADRESVEAKLDSLVGQYGDPEQIASVYRSDPRLMQQLEMAVIEEKVIDWLIDQAKVTERKRSFQDVMQQNNA